MGALFVRSLRGRGGTRNQLGSHSKELEQRSPGAGGRGAARRGGAAAGGGGGAAAHRADTREGAGSGPPGAGRARTAAAGRDGVPRVGD